VKRSQRKKQLKAERASKRKDPQVKSGFRKLTIDGAIYQWKVGRTFVEIRVPGKLKLKWLVSIWSLQDCTSIEEWHKRHMNCVDDYCVHTGNDHCGKYWVVPAQIRKYIDEMRTVTCNEGGTCGCKK
jgi:hypothetical protein